MNSKNALILHFYSDINRQKIMFRFASQVANISEPLLGTQCFNNFITLSNALVSGSAVPNWSQNYKEQHAHSCTWKNVVYNILVLRVLRGGPAREEMLPVSMCSHGFRKLNTTKSVCNTLKSKKIFASKKVKKKWRESVWRRARPS